MLIIADEPGRPTGVEVVDWDKDHADLKWTKPEKDGGAPITGYIIEFKVNVVKMKIILRCYGVKGFSITMVYYYMFVRLSKLLFFFSLLVNRIYTLSIKFCESNVF